VPAGLKGEHMKISFFVPGLAKTSGSKSGFMNRKTGKIIFAPANPKQKEWQGAVKWYADKAANRMIPTTEAVVLECTFYRKRPDSHYRMANGQLTNQIKPRYLKAMPTSKPDSLKLCRAVEDAMSGIIYTDDSHVCDHGSSPRMWGKDS